MPVTRTRLVAIALATAVLALTACGGADGTPPAAAPQTSTPATASATGGPTTEAGAGATASPTAGAVPETLDFTARTLDGVEFAGSSLAGKPAVLWFWAAWCTRCRGVADSVAAVQRDNADRLTVLGVAGLGSGDEAMRRFARDTGITGFPSLADDDGTVWRRFGVTSQEHYVLLDSTGKVRHNGPLSQADLRRRVAELS
ncbi:TlpA family protein disulfide reductase [Micromonospora endolithica]|uniref:Redoxin n=1 Tax=Micromonospora endolithica TaxID=230091 RepID=A0A3A9ZLF4_9ACTN|nr:redoxin domain-containing protein [Micromonospora endolithica]RKN49128.1 redoxin [Micromonospora endolithica]TWJ23284.1 thiol-disulfide isomerase/thioredoxin [Micromonospora endolithica]